MNVTVKVIISHKLQFVNTHDFLNNRGASCYNTYTQYTQRLFIFLPQYLGSLLLDSLASGRLKKTVLWR